MTTTVHEPRVTIACTQTLLDVVNQLIALDLSLADRSQLEYCVKARRVTGNDIRLLAQLIDFHRGDLSLESNVTVTSLLQGSKGVQFPKEELPEPSQQLLQRREYLRARQEQREYARMCKDVSKVGATLVRDSSLPPEGERSTFQQVGVGLNMLIAALAIFFVVNYLCLNLQVSDTVRLSAGILAFIVVLVIEMVLFIIRATRGEARARTDKQKAAGELFPGHKAGGPRDPVPTSERLKQS